MVTGSYLFGHSTSWLIIIITRDLQVKPNISVNYEEALRVILTLKSLKFAEFEAGLIYQIEERIIDTVM